jgi:hypothetical protein
MKRYYKMYYPVFYFFMFSVLNVPCANAQVLSGNATFTKQDTLRGSVGPGRLGWNVLHYDITVQPDYAKP